ncbi:Heptaprenyl diphosphate synthase component I [Thermosinus carboxydivorans Nor1]|uniref:Heptaprenyl diphosphate synthase component I n=1 Tax=Thermosinus carboxydivorans Nor1 TaxID=401526 RepID=A1HP08_9FIRM|nr:Gx transporter family protein [Thermosinus carboxydivorans]EAX48116.1 Heptaprenyl diphosphate synthase component I [Thermosinus carboxydivorans Nor1]
MHTRRMVLIALLTAVAGVLHAVEGWLPLPVAVPGAKLGLANIVSLVVLELFGWRAALLVGLLRVLLGTLLGGVLLGPAFAMALSGAVVSTAVMAVILPRWRPPFSLAGISVIGAAVHNIVQMLTAAFLVASPGLFWYLPYLLLFAAPTGLVTGLTAQYFLAKLPRDFTSGNL